MTGLAYGWECALARRWPGTAMADDAKAPNRAPRAAVADPGPREYAALNDAMDRYARGEAAAFSVLYERLGPRLRGFLMRVSGNPATADDLLQESFLRIHRARGAFSSGAPVVPWALSIARNVYRDHLRRKKLRDPGSAPRYEDDDDSPEERLPSTAGHPEELAVAREAADIVRRALAALPLSQREAFVLLRFEHLSVEEAAEVLGTTATAVKLRKFRAAEAIREALAKRSEEAG